MDNDSERAKYLGRFMALTEMFVKAASESDERLTQIIKKQADDALRDYNSYLQVKNFSDKLSDSAIDRGNNS
jgi:hypothetical protein